MWVHSEAVGDSLRKDKESCGAEKLVQHRCEGTGGQEVKHPGGKQGNLSHPTGITQSPDGPTQHVG